MNNRILKDEEVETLLYNIDMDNGFVDFGTMANPEYKKLIPEQLKLIKYVRSQNGVVSFVLEGHNKNAREFKLYPQHSVLGTKEADLIPELCEEQNKINTYTFYKNCINGMLLPEVQEQIKRYKNLKSIIYSGVVIDLCVGEFAVTNSRFLDQINKEVKLFLVKSTTDTFDAPNHNREEWTEIACKLVSRAGIELVDNCDDLIKREEELGLRKIRRRK